MPVQIRMFLASATLLASVSFATAQEEPAVDCSNAVTQMDLNICSHRDYAEADEELNVAYKKAMDATQKMDADLKDIGEQYVGAVDALKRAQRSWIGYRDGQCELSGFEARGGSMEPMLVSSCLAELTRKRTAELKAVYETED